MSENQCQLVQIDASGSELNRIFYYWGNNAYDFLQKEQDHNPIDYIVLNHTDPQLIANTFGFPEKTARCGNKTLWIYQDSTHLFSKLISGHHDPYTMALYGKGHVEIPAVAFKHQTGARDGFSQKADPKLHQPGILLYGTTLILQPGTYLITLHSNMAASLSLQHAESDEHPSYFELITHSKTQPEAVIQHQSLVHSNDATPWVFKITLQQLTWVEPRLFWGGNEAFIVKSIAIQAIQGR